MTKSELARTKKLVASCLDAIADYYGRAPTAAELASCGAIYQAVGRKLIAKAAEAALEPGQDPEIGDGTHG